MLWKKLQIPGVNKADMTPILIDHTVQYVTWLLSKFILIIIPAMQEKIRVTIHQNSYKRIIQYVTFCDFSSLSMISSKFIHVLACISTSLFIAK